MAYRPMMPGECVPCYLEDAARFAATPRALKPKVLAELRAKNAKTAANLNAYEKRIVAEEAARLKEMANLKAKEESLRAPSYGVRTHTTNIPFSSQNMTNAFTKLSRRGRTRRTRRTSRKSKKNTRRR